MQDFIESKEKIKLQESQPVSSWPSPQDYNESVQNPSLAFADAELAAAEPELNIIGLPKPASGNFASVYRLFSQAEEWAVRCFLQPLADQNSRYLALSQKLSTVDAPFFAQFEFMQNGIRVRREWFPIIKMEWVHGQSLSDYIKTNLNDSRKLNTLADEFKKMILLMREHGIAHGDLQHGNIIVQDDGSIRLVDYDGCYVPELSGLKSNELGHRNYQHPKRSASDFNQNIDNFSSWLIWVSIKAVAEDPHLWDKLHGGDECLLFRRHDFLRSEYSRAFHLLEMHYNENIRLHGRFLRSLLNAECSQTPALDAPLDVPTNLPPLKAVVELGIVKEGKESSKAEKEKAQQFLPLEYINAKKKIDRDKQVMKATLAALVILPTVVAVLALSSGFMRVFVDLKSAAVVHEFVQNKENLKAAEASGTKILEKRASIIQGLLRKGLRDFNSRSYGAARHNYQNALDFDKEGGPSVIGLQDKAFAYKNLAECKMHEKYGDFGASDFQTAHVYLKSLGNYSAAAFACEHDAATSAMAYRDYDFALNALIKCLDESSELNYRDAHRLIDDAVFAASKTYEKMGQTEGFRQLWSAVTATRKTELVENMLGSVQSRASQLERESQGKATGLWSLLKELAVSRPDVDERFLKTANERLQGGADSRGSKAADEAATDETNSEDSSARRLPRPPSNLPSSRVPRPSSLSRN